MIFITLGSQKFQFNRLLKAVDELCVSGQFSGNVFAQIGYSDYEPQNYRYKKFMDRNEFAESIIQADIVITHGGTGAIINAVKQGKKVIAVPRLARYGEHVDDHQIQLLKEFDEMRFIEACYDPTNLKEAFQNIQSRTYLPYVSNTERIICSIEEFLNTSK